MTIDRDYLDGLLKQLEQDHADGRAKMQQAFGAILVVKALLDRLAEAAPAPDPAPAPEAKS